MEQVRCTNCGSTAIIPDGSGEFCKCEACGSTFNVPRAALFSKVELDHTQDIRAWREYLAKQLRLQQDSSKARDYGGVKLFAQKILSVLPDDFCAQYYVALADRYDGSDVGFLEFLRSSRFTGVTPDELREVTASLVSTVEPKYLDAVKEFIARAYPSAYADYDAALDRNIKSYIQKLRYSKVTDRDVFICHRTAEPDQDIADAICTRLEERGLRCWIAPRNILAGSQNYERDILKGVENSKVFLLVSSFKSIYSQDCEMELKAAVLENKALYSYRIDDTPYDGAFERALSQVQWLDAQDDPYAHLEQLVIDIKGILARDEREKSELEEKRMLAREKERMLAEQRRTKEQERLDRLEKIVASGVAATGAARSVSFGSKLRRAEIEVQSQNFSRAENIIDGILDEDPECAQAWWLLMLCDYKLAGDEMLLNSGKDFTVHRYYHNAVRFADDEPNFERRLNDVLSAFSAKIVRKVKSKLDDAQRLYRDEDFSSLSETLDDCRDAFADEDSMLFKKFPDVASTYYWLRLWAKYGQTPLVCVEDITRETEYNLAVKYASPAQAREYANARETVARNAQLFLRERSKNRTNDSKLSDYLVDNKNILPIDTYNYYSSMLYFRKMLRDVNMTEDQLGASTADISTNEYFMLAQSLATEEQKRIYDELLEKIENNRADKSRRVKEEKARDERETVKKQRRQKAFGIAQGACSFVFAGLCWLMFVIAVINVIDGVHDNAETIDSLLITCFVFRVLCDIVMFANKQKYAVIISTINLTISIAIIVIANFVGSLTDDIEVEISQVALTVMSVITIVLEGIKLSKHNNNKQTGR